MAFDNFRFFHGLEANLPPATIDRLAEPAYTTDTNKFFICDGANWNQVTGGITKAAADGYYDALGAAAAVTLSGLGGVPTGRTINGYDLTANRSLTYSDVGADVAGAAAAITISGLGGVPSTRKITSSIDLSADRNLTYSDVGADASGAAATVAGNLTTHANLTTAHGSTSANTASTIVQRDASGNFSAGTITANLTGNASGSAGSCTGNAATATSLAGGTAGYVPFQTGSGATSFDAGLFWDNTNKRFGLGTTAPGAKLDVMGDTQVSDFSKSGLRITQQYVDLGGDNLLGPSLVFVNTNLGAARWFAGAVAATVGNPGDVSNVPGGLSFYTKSNDGVQGSGSTMFESMRISYNGNVGIGTTSPGYPLDVAGAFRCSTGFGCNGATPQTAYASGGAAGGTATSGGYGFVSAAEMNAFVTLLTNVRIALVANGVMS